MNKTLYSLFFTWLIITVLGEHATAQEFQWPRDKAFEIGGGMSVGSYHFQASYIRFFQPRKISEIPFSQRFKALIGKKQLDAFPCKKKTINKVPPGFSAKTSLFYELGNGKGIRYRIMGVDAALLHTIYSTKKLFISLKGGVTVSNNRLLTPIEEGNKSNFYERYKYGVLGGIEIDQMIGKYQSTSIIAGWQQCYLLNGGDIWGSKRWYAFIGLRFNIPTY